MPPLGARLSDYIGGTDEVWSQCKYRSRHLSDVQTLLDLLPVNTITVLASGYLGYRLAYTGKDTKHKATDKVFLSLAFGLVA